MFRLIFPLLCFLFLPTFSGAQPALLSAGGGSSAVSVATMVSETKSVPPGGTFTIALRLAHPEKWHSYYKNSGGVELPPTIAWKLPPGFRAGEIRWPAPEVKDGLLGKSFIYSGSPVFLTDIIVPPDAQPGPVKLTAEATWQICDQTCINEKKTFELPLEISRSREAPAKDPSHAALFAEARAKLPLTLYDVQFSAQPEKTDIILTLTPASSFTGPPTDFVPDQPFVRNAADGGTIARSGDTWTIRLKTRDVDALDRKIERGTEVSGVLLGSTPVNIPLTRIGLPPPATVPPGNFLKTLGGMFLGGLILNLMPCVFPVIGLKIMGFVQQSGADRRKIALHGGAFTAGVVLSFIALAGALFVLRNSAFGSNVEKFNWGYQLQIPAVVLVLMLLMFLLGLNMAGVFEIGARATSVGGSLQSKQGLAGSFFSGVLATVVATPCSAPFLGVAIGAAVALPAVPFFTAFLVMALGLSLPYLLLSVFPKLLDFLPRPGPWMESFKQAMSFLLFATAGYLLWVYGGQIGFDNLLGPIFGLTAIAAAAWIYGRWNLPHRKKSVRVTAMAAALAFATAGVLACRPAKSEIVWETWSEDRAARLLTEGKPVYIDFTAQWCATCQVNKKRAYTKEVLALMREKGVVMLKADKTNPNPQIDAALEKLGRSAIPVNVLQKPGGEPMILPEILSPQIVTEALRKL